MRWLRAYATGGRLLEIGSASGWFLAQARDAGFEVEGIEPAADVAFAATARWNVPVQAATAETASLPDRELDVVVAWHALEHIAIARRRARSACIAALRPGGLLMIEVPNVESAAARTQGAGLVPPRPRPPRRALRAVDARRAPARGGLHPAAGRHLPDRRVPAPGPDRTPGRSPGRSSRRSGPCIAGARTRPVTRCCGQWRGLTGPLLAEGAQHRAAVRGRRRELPARAPRSAGCSGSSSASCSARAPRRTACSPPTRSTSSSRCSAATCAWRSCRSSASAGPRRQLRGAGGGRDRTALGGRRRARRRARGALAGARRGAAHRRPRDRDREPRDPRRWRPGCRSPRPSQAAALAAARRFVASAILYVISSAASLVLATGVHARVRRRGRGDRRPRRLGGAVPRARRATCGGSGVHAGVALRRAARTSPTWRMAGAAAAGSAVPLASQAMLTIALAAVSGVVGTVTAYTYGYFVALLLASMTAGAIGFTSMPGLVGELGARGAEAARGVPADVRRARRVPLRAAGRGGRDVRSPRHRPRARGPAERRDARPHVGRPADLPGHGPVLGAADAGQHARAVHAAAAGVRRSRPSSR